jgi:CubicO group peptidase (beta-lactamase class C family)
MKHARALLIGMVVAASCGGEPTPPPVSQPVTSPAQQQEMPTTGTGMPGMASFDQRVRDLMRQYGIPGGAVALVRDGKLIYARGFGYAGVLLSTSA